MIESALKISIDCPEFHAHFQEQILDHWLEIKEEARFPCKRDFRPQNFPKYLSQLAIVEVCEDNSFADRLTGGTVCDVLRLNTGEVKLSSPPDTNINTIVTTMLSEASEAAEPMYYTGSFSPATRPPIEFSALIIPFSKDEDEDELGSLLIAFDFTKRTAVDLFAVS